jgi:hypothetical protein
MSIDKETDTMKANQDRLARYCAKMQACAEEDTESAHIKADDLLCDLLTELGYGELIARYEAIGKWYA